MIGWNPNKTLEGFGFFSNIMTEFPKADIKYVLFLFHCLVQLNKS